MAGYIVRRLFDEVLEWYKITYIDKLFMSEETGEVEDGEKTADLDITAEKKDQAVRERETYEAWQRKEEARRKAVR